MKKTLRLLSAVMAFLMLAGAASLFASAKVVFNYDVEPDRWSSQDIAYAVEKGYFAGVGNGFFDPEGDTTRAMAVTVLWRMAGEPEPASRGEFSDVPAGAWYADAADWAFGAEITNGVAAHTFSPDGALTREQLVTMLCRFADKMRLPFNKESDISVFPDSGDISSWAAHSAAWATFYGVLIGSENGEFSPKGNCTREQLAAIIRRFENNVTVEYSDPVLISRYTEKEYSLVEDADVYVSTAGDDSAAGTKDAPVRTFARAVEMVRDIKGTKDGSVVVAFFAGEYGDPAVVMTSADSGTKDAPVIYCAYGDGDVVFSGGAVFAENDFSELSDEEKAMFDSRFADSIKKADMSEKYPDYKVTDTFFSDTGAMTVARFPNKYEDDTDHLMPAGYNSSDNTNRIVNSVLKRRISKYHTVEGLYLYGYLTTGWYKDLLETDGYTVDPETGGFDFFIPHPETARMGTLRYGEFPDDEYNAVAIVNVSEELDAKGEYFVDTATKTMYVYSPEGSYSFTTKARCVEMTRADYITFRGLTFTSYSDSMIFASYCHGITIDRCTVTKCSGEFALSFTGCDVGRDFDLSITDSYFSVFADRVVKADAGCSGAHYFDRRGNVGIYNNFFSFTNLTVDEGCAVKVMKTSEAHISHNEFEDISRGAIDYGGSHGTLIEYNSFKRCMYNSSDGGAIYSWNGHEDWGNVIRYNVFWPSPWMGVYIDDDEPGTTVYRNLFIQSAVVVHDGRSNAMNENVLIRSSLSVTRANREAIDEAIEAGDLTVLLSNNYYKQWKTFLDRVRSNEDLLAGFTGFCPEVFELSLDLADVNSKNFVLNPCNEAKGNLYIKKDNDWSEETLLGEISSPWCEIEGNRMVLWDENPIFVDPSVGDYRVREDAGFPDLQFEKMGRE